jgi:hypothetical protein
VTIPVGTIQGWESPIKSLIGVILAVSTTCFNTAFLTGPLIHDRTHL